MKNHHVGLSRFKQFFGEQRKHTFQIVKIPESGAAAYHSRRTCRTHFKMEKNFKRDCDSKVSVH